MMGKPRLAAILTAWCHDAEAVAAALREHDHHVAIVRSLAG